MKIGMIILVTLLMVWNTSMSQEKRNATDAKGLVVGQKAPLFEALDADSSLVKLSDALRDGPVVLIFYRGQWCPVCNQHLSSIQDSLQMIMNKGARVITVSPEKPVYLNKMVEKTQAQFSLLYDDGYRIANAYDVTFTPPKTTLFIYNTALNAKLKESHSDDSQRLPIPATYIIGMDGVIIWRQFDANYKQRSTVKDILLHLPTIN